MFSLCVKQEWAIIVALKYVCLPLLKRQRCCSKNSSVQSSPLQHFGFLAAPFKCTHLLPWRQNDPRGLSLRTGVKRCEHFLNTFLFCHVCCLGLTSSILWVRSFGPTSSRRVNHEHTYSETSNKNSALLVLSGPQVKKIISRGSIFMNLTKQEKCRSFTFKIKETFFNLSVLNLCFS